MVPADQSDVAIAGAGDVTSTVPTDQTSENVFLNTLDTVQGVTTPTVAPQPQGFNLVQSSADAIRNATTGTQGLVGFTPGAVSSAPAASQGFTAATARSRGAGSQGYDAATAGSQGYTASEAAARGYEAIANAAAERARAQGYSAERIAGVDPVRAERVQGVDPLVAERTVSGQIADTDLSRYTNPFEAQVVQQSLADLERARQMQQNVEGAQAQAAGAFGGSRQAIAEAETNRAFAEQAARTAAGLRQAGFTQAQQAAQADIASRLQSDLANQRAALQAGTTTAQLGQQAQLANQRATLQADTTSAQLGQQAQALNQAAANQAAQFGAAAQNRAALQNAQLATQATLANQAAQNSGEFPPGERSRFTKCGARNAASQFAAQAANRAALANQAPSIKRPSLVRKQLIQLVYKMHSWLRKQPSLMQQRKIKLINLQQAQLTKQLWQIRLRRYKQGLRTKMLSYKARMLIWRLRANWATWVSSSLTSLTRSIRRLRNRAR